MKLATIHQYLGEQRRKQNLAQRDVAEALNVEQATISFYETGKRSIPLDLLDRWLQLLEIEVKVISKDCRPVKNEENTQEDLKTFHELKRKRNYLIAELRANMAESLIQVPEFQKEDEETGERQFWPYSLWDNAYVGFIETRYDHPQQKYLAVEYTHEEVNVYRFLNVKETYDGFSEPVWLNADRIYFTEDDFLTYGGKWDPKNMEIRKMTILRKNADRPNDVDIIDPEGFPLRALVQMHENYYRFAEVIRELEVQKDYIAMKQELEAVKNELVNITFSNRLWNGSVNPEFEFWNEEDKAAIDIPLYEAPRSWVWVEEGVQWIENFQETQEIVLSGDSEGHEHYYVLKNEDGSRVIGLTGIDKKPAVFKSNPHRPHVIYRVETEESSLNEAELTNYEAILEATRSLDDLKRTTNNSCNEK